MSELPFPEPAQLAPLCWRHVIEKLDPFSLQQLKLSSKLFCTLVCTAMCNSSTVTQLPLDTLKWGVDLAAKGPAASCLCITPPRRPVALSRLNHRQRCEQRLAVFLDNLGGHSPNIQALDISTALQHITCSTLQLLVESLPQLHQLSLCPVATCGQTETDVLCMLQQLPELQACDLDCSLFSLPQSSCSSLQAGHTLVQQNQSLNTSNSQQQHFLLHHMHRHNLLPAQQETEHCPAGQHDGSSSSTDNPAPVGCQKPHGPTGQEVEPAATTTSRSGSSRADTTATPSGQSAAASTSVGCGSTCAGCVCPCACSAPWVGLSCLSRVQHLRLQHLQPGSVRTALKAVSQMPGLHSLSLTGLNQASASLVLAPCRPSAHSEEAAGAAGTAGAAGGEVAAATAGAGGEGEARWLLAGLQDVEGLTRLELGVCVTSTTPRTSGGHSYSSSSAGALVVPAHTGVAAGYPAGPAAVLSCSWSCIQQLQEVVLHGICLDSYVFAATLACQQLTGLFVGGLDLQQDVHAAIGFAPASSDGLCRLKVLQAEQHFDLGPHSAAALFPALISLKVTHAGACRPDLRCLEHHPRLASLDVSLAAGAAGCWSLKDLQLGHLVHLEGMQHLRLAEAEVCGDPRAGSSQGSCGGSGASCSPYRSSTGCGGKSGSHWLPCTHLSQVTSLELRGPVTDQSLGQLPGQFPALKRLTVDSSYFASDGGLQRLTCAPQLELLVLRNCSHFTDYGLEVLLMGCSLKVVAVQGCARINQKACHRIRKACRYGGSQLLWYGCEAAAAAASPDCNSSCSQHAARHSALSSHGPSKGQCPRQDSSTAASSMPGSAGSEFLQRCWRQEQQQQQGQQREHGLALPVDAERPPSPGPVSALVAAATAVWLESCPESRLGSHKVQLADHGGSSSAVGCSSTTRAALSSRTSAIRAAAGVTGSSAASQSGAGVAAVASGEGSRVRRVSGNCMPSGDVHGQRGGECWSRGRWSGGGGSTLAH